MGTGEGSKGHVALRFTGENYAYLQALAAERRSTLSVVMNAELEFLRTWGLTTSQQKAMAAEAARRGVSSWQHFRLLLRQYAKSLPPATRSQGPAAEELPTVRTSFDLDPPNADWLKGVVEDERLGGPTAGCNFVLEFARTYGLRADLLAAVEAEAQRQSTTVRSLLRVQMWRFAREIVAKRRHK